VTRTRTATSTVRLVLLMTAMTAMVIALAFASPAAAQFVDEDPDGGTEDADTAEQDTAEEEAEPAGGNGFVGGDEQEAAPTGGVDAGFGGGADQGTGLGAPHALAIGLLGLAMAGHVAQARRVAAVPA
jgi:hypothetical protein